MYFVDRAEAGRKLAKELMKFKDQPTVVLVMSEKSAVVGAQIAMKLHANMVLYMVKDIRLPNEIESTAAISSNGQFSYNSYMSAGEIEEIASEYRGFIEEQRIQKNHDMNVLLGSDGVINKDILRRHVVIVVFDGVSSGFPLKMVEDFLKSIAIKRFVIATPIATVEATDVMHTIADEFYCLSVPENFMGVDHYYDEENKVTVEGALKLIQNISLVWSQDDSMQEEQA